MPLDIFGRAFSWLKSQLAPFEPLFDDVVAAVKFKRAGERGEAGGGESARPFGAQSVVGAVTWMGGLRGYVEDDMVE